MAFSTHGGIEWEKNGTTGTLTIRPATTPWSGWAKGQMAGFESWSSSKPWGQVRGNWKLIIEDGVLNIGNNAFNSSDGFKNDLHIPDSVTSIGIDAFLYCSGFRGVMEFGKGLNYVDDSAFMGCRYVHTLIFHSEKPPTLKKNAFQLCAWDPYQTFRVISSWADPTNFPGFSYVGWNYITVPRNTAWIKDDDGNWVNCDTYIAVNGKWKEAVPDIKDEDVWK